jgi:molecular chaperone DnaK
VNPDEAVAVGAAIQGGVLRGDVKDILLLDVLPLSLGIETMGGVFTKMIERNSTIPTKKTETFSTAADNQTQVGIRVFQGEREMCSDNVLLGQFDLVGIPPAPRQVPKIEVTFDIDANGILKVTAVDKMTKKEQSISIKSTGGLSETEIQRMIKESEANREADLKRREGIEARNHAESVLHQAEKSFAEYKEKLPQDIVTRIQTAIDELRSTKLKETASAEEIKSKVQALETALMSVGEHIYKGGAAGAGAQNSQQGNGNAGGPKGDGQTVDAEFREKK